MTGPQHGLLRASGTDVAVITNGSTSSPNAKLASNAVEVATNTTIDKTNPRNVESSMPFVAQSRRNVFNFSLALPVSHNRTGHGQSTRPSKANQDVADENEPRAQRGFSPPVCAPLGFCVRLELILVVAIMVSPAKQPGCGKGRSSRQCFDDRELKRQKSRRKCSGSWEASSLSRRQGHGRHRPLPSKWSATPSQGCAHRYRPATLRFLVLFGVQN